MFYATAPRINLDGLAGTKEILGFFFLKKKNKKKNPTDQQQKHHLSKINEGLHFAINML